ncbi:hypothetical protein [Massilia pseudoviolaceinigra]|uniref:hypothetical protein n=1 Tax=Massilia pseudoviolaceinigra TaxID=3057165 RepID=UPI0027965F75|nr:hypothetical protein [Massilia sp. CCM 9206]MDQ1921676.1 hypothetical protein [Massilia sp. CCM 9206]
MSKEEEFKYDPAGLLDAVKALNHLPSDAALATLLRVAPPVISKVRHHRMLVGDSLILRCIEFAGMTVPQVRAYIGVHP